MGRGVRCLLCTFVDERDAIRPGRAVMYASVSVQHKCDYMRVLIRSSFPLNPIPRPSTLHVSQDHATMPFHTTARQKFANHSHHSLHTITHASPTSERAKRQTSAQSPRWLIERRRRGPFSHCFLANRRKAPRPKYGFRRIENSESDRAKGKTGLY
jgi:hypothetical protein